MGDTQYEVTKSIFPAWAERVEAIAGEMIEDELNHNDELLTYHDGFIHGLAIALNLTRQCGDAQEFVRQAIVRARMAKN